MKPKILFIYTTESTFIKRDLIYLKNKYEVEIFRFSNRIINDLLSIPPFITRLRNHDISFVWFASRFAFLTVLISKILAKKTIVILGGYEVANLPEIRYGGLRSKISKIQLGYTIKNGDYILAVDQGLKNDAIKNFGEIARKIEILPTGYNSNLFKPNKTKRKFALTVCKGDTWERAKLKGLDIFIAAAKLLPKEQFKIVGMSGAGLDRLLEISPKNVDFVDALPEKELLDLYQRSKVYCQFSIREGLPNSLCEAMLCNCIPVGSDVQGVQSAIGDTGYLVQYGDIKASAEVIRKALRSKTNDEPRSRIICLFSQQKRERRLKKIISNLFNDF